MSQPSFDLDFDDGGLPTYSVSELAQAINGALRRQFTDGVWLRGEVQGYSERNGHCYFRVAESSESGKAVIDVALFANSRMRLRPILQKHRLRLGDGLKVRIFGFLDFYGGNGRLTLKMSGLDPRYTLGEMALERDDIVRRLVSSGLYDANRTRRLAGPPLRVGVVTSVGSAAWHDFTHELELSGYSFTLRVVDVRVQGDFAATMVTSAITLLARDPLIDVICVIRGGGSKTELAVFDSESIALAIAAAPMPVFTGLGHEVDRSIADEVAHTAFKTPTACAGALIERVAEFVQRSELAWQAISVIGRRAIDDSTARLTERARRIEQRTVAAVERADQRLLDRSHRTASIALRILDRASGFHDTAAARLRQTAQRSLAQHEAALQHRETHVRALDPINTLARGWSLTRTADGTLVRSIAQLSPGETITTTLADGRSQSTIDSLSKDTSP